MFWFIINFVSIFDNNHSQLIDFFSQTTKKFYFHIFNISFYFFFQLTISEIFEDYINRGKNKKCRK